MHRRGTESALFDETTLAELESIGPAMLADLTTLYFTQAASQVAELDDAIGDDEFETARLLAHNLKGGSATLGAGHVAAILTEIEAAARGGDGREARDLLVRLRRGLEDTESAFACRLEGAPTRP